MSCIAYMFFYQHTHQLYLSLPPTVSYCSGMYGKHTYSIQNSVGLAHKRTICHRTDLISVLVVFVYGVAQHVN